MNTHYSMKFFKLILKHLLALALTILVLNASLKVFSDGYNLDALMRSTLRANAEINFDAEALKFTDGKNIKTSGIASTIYAKSGLKDQDFNLNFKAIADARSQIKLLSKKYKVKKLSFKSIVVYDDIELKVNGLKESLYNFKVQKGDLITLSFKARNAIPSLEYLQHQHGLKSFAVLFTTTAFVVLYYLVLFNKLLVPACLKLKSLKDKTGADKFYLYLIFLIFIIVSILGFNFKGTSSKVDRRDLSVFPSLTVDTQTNKSLNQNFFNELNTYLEDRFGLRNLFINSKLQSDILLKSQVENGNCLWNKENNYFASLADFIYDKFDEKFNQKLLDNVNNLANYFNEHGIDFVLAIVPEPYEIYTDEYSFVPNAPKDLVEADTVKLLKDKANCKIIFPYEELKTASKQDFVFFKADHHWTDFGAYVGYQEIIKAINSKYPEVLPLNWDKLPHSKSNLIRSDFDRKFTIGESALSVGLRSKRHLDSEYNYYEPQLPYVDLPDAGALESYRKWQNDNGYPLKVYTIGTSFNENLNPFIAATFKDVIYSRLNQGTSTKYQVLKYTKHLIESFKPDVVVLTLSVPNIAYFTQNNFGFED